MSLQDRLNRAVKCADKVQDGCCHEEMADAYQRAYELMHDIACEAIAENITLRLTNQ